MSALQWALLILGVGIVLWLIWSSHRDKRLLEERAVTASAASRARVGQDWAQAVSEKREAPLKPGISAGDDFDEHGVSKPRKRTGVDATIPPGTMKAPTVDIAPRNPTGKLIAFYIAEHEGTNILGPKIHAALQARSLTFGVKKIYHRLDGDRPVFSVASLVKPGTLDPAEAAEFSTPGLSVFLQLPVATPAVAAFEDMLDTAKALARALNAELFDTEQRSLLTAERERELHTQVQDWARQHTGM